MGQVSGVNRRRDHQLNPSLKAEFFEVNTTDGRSFVGAKFEQQLKNGGLSEFRTELGRLEFIEKRAAEYAASGNREDRHEQVGDVHVWLKRGDFGTRKDAVGVQLFQKDRDDPREWQRFGTFLDDLTTAVKEGKELERDLGHDQRWHVLVYASSLTKDELGRVHAQAVRSFASEEAAREHLGKSTGLALYSEPQGREFGRGETLELYGDATLLGKGHQPTRTVEQQLGRAEFSREQMSENFVVARWNDASVEPIVGQRVAWEGHGEAYNGVPQEYRAGPASSRDRGPTADTLWVLIAKGDGPGAKGKIVGFSNDRGEMTNELARREGVIKDVTRDWEQQSFGMDRNQFKQQQSM